MLTSLLSRAILIGSTGLFVIWTLSITLFWPLEDYADRVHAYAEHTDQIATGMSVGLTAYVSVLGLIIGWHVTRPPSGKVAAVSN